MKIKAVIPTYNEQENIGPLLEKLFALPCGLEVIVVDDNSPDGTGAILDAAAAREPRLSVIHRPGKLGLGTAHIAGFRKALEDGADLVLSMDADMSHDPARIPVMLEAAASADLVIGSRYTPGGSMVNSPLGRVLLSRGANGFARLALGLRAGDCTAGFRCYRAAVLKAIDLGSIFSDGYSFLIEMMFKVQRLGFSVAEVPITYNDRTLGASKISRDEIFKALKTVVKLALYRFGAGADREAA